MNDPRDERPIDPLVVLRAEIDQMISTAPELARAAFGLFEAFQGEGATQLTSDPGDAPG